MSLWKEKENISHDRKKREKIAKYFDNAKNDTTENYVLIEQSSDLQHVKREAYFMTKFLRRQWSSKGVFENLIQ